MRRLSIFAAFLLASPLVWAEDDPEPTGRGADAEILRLGVDADDSAAAPDKIQARAKRLVKRLETDHARLSKAGKPDKARDVKDRVLLVESIAPGKGLDPKLTVPKVLARASVDGKYRELLHVLHVPGDTAFYKDFTDFGYSPTPNWQGYNNLLSGHWVYVEPRWYIWKEKP